jgi:trk system potassium uptake protein TrkH
MNYPLVARLIGAVSWLMAGTMAFSLPWAWPAFGQTEVFESRGFWGLIGAMIICLVVGFALRYSARNAQTHIYRKEAMVVVGLSWILATVLGALPFYFAGVDRGREDDAAGTPVPMNVADCLFESQSGFSTTGATVLTKIEDPELVPRCILFWRSSTHFLGGLGIIVLFVAILGQGSAGKALMRAEMPGPSKEGAQTRMQHTAWTFAAIYCVLNLVLAVILHLEGMTWFDALCHAFGTMATGGFSTYDSSLGWFGKHGYNGALIEYTVVLFMVLAGTNFTLLYFLLLRKPGRVLRDVEWRAYIAILVVMTSLVISFGMYSDDFVAAANPSQWQEFKASLRYGLFQVVSIMTTTGFGTHDFDGWNSFGRGSLFLLMFIGGCAGSTGGGMKVIRHVLFFKVMRLEIERSFHPSVVRPLRVGGEPVSDPELSRNILVYFSLILVIFVLSWMFVVACEPDSTWTDYGQPADDKLIDAASSVAATLNNIGPGLGIVSASQNYAKFTWPTKILFTWLMMIGRLEIFAILVLFAPRFWRNY